MYTEQDDFNTDWFVYTNYTVQKRFSFEPYDYAIIHRYPMIAQTIIEIQNLNNINRQFVKACENKTKHV